MLKISDIVLNDDLSDEEYDCYNPNIPINVLGYDEIDTDDIRINIVKNLDSNQAMKLLNKYLSFLANCENKVATYLSEVLSTELDEDWVDDIEVYELSITIKAINDYGATIVFSNVSVFGDCDIEIDFDKETIEDHR